MTTSSLQADVQKTPICKDCLKPAFEQKSMSMSIRICLLHLERHFMPGVRGMELALYLVCKSSVNARNKKQSQVRFPLPLSGNTSVSNPFVRSSFIFSNSSLFISMCNKKGRFY